MTAGERVAASARGCVGARFRLHGREAASGLDCVGLVAASLRGAGWVGEVPSGYPLRGGATDLAARALDRVLLCVAGPGQLHLAVRVPGGVVHADAGLRRVVERPGPLAWPLIGAWQWGDG